MRSLNMMRKQWPANVMKLSPLNKLDANYDGETKFRKHNETFQIKTPSFRSVL